MRKITARSSLKLLALLIVLTFSTYICISESFASNSKDTANASIKSAEDVLVSAYQAALEVEQAGADISNLLVQLNDAGDFLVNAHIAYKLEDFDGATRFADFCYDIGEDLKNQVDELRVEAYRSTALGFWWTLTGSLVGVIAVVFSGFWGWRVFKRRYILRVACMLETKSEVEQSES